MNDWQKIMKHSTFRLLDHSNQTTFHQMDYTALTSFAIDDALTLSISNQQSPPTMRLWVHEDTVVLGIPDSRLPHIKAGIQLLADSGYQAIIRNSGGLAVALDHGVLNISLILPDIKKVSIHDGYEGMFSFIQYMLRDLTNEIKAYEIVGSYCPGDYDLSIRGIKFAGISQRRIRDGAAIQIYLDVEGDSQGKANLIQEFYDVSLRGEATTFIYPDVNPHVMGSLSELLGIKLTMEDMKKRVYQTVEELSEQIISSPFSEAEWTSFHTRLKQMEKRNEKIAAWQ